jgi:secreted Zn-dependent insulinase-like peptidase
LQDPGFLDERVEAFLEQFEQELQKMSEEDFKARACLIYYPLPFM